MQFEPFSVLFLHPFPANSLLFKYQFEALEKEDIPYISIDYPGFGTTPAFDTFDTLPQITDYVVSKLYERKIKKVIAVGDSMGGYIMFDMWRRHKNLIKGFVFVSTRAQADDEQAKQTRFNTIEKIKKEGTQFLIKAMIEAQTSPATKQNEEKMKFLEFIMKQASPTGIINALKAMANREDSTQLLKSITVPTVVIAGKDDEKVTPPDVVKDIAEGIQGAEFFVLENSAHIPPFENPEDFNKILINFVRSI